MIANRIFGREDELMAVRRRLAARRSFLLYGPSRMGKTSLVLEALREHPESIYCPQSQTMQVVLRTVATALWHRSGVARQKLRSAEEVKTKSAVSLKGIVLDTLREGRFWIALDHLQRPSQAFAAEVKEIAGWGATPVLAVSNSDHMEDLGFLLPLFSDRSEKMELRPLNEAAAQAFLAQAIKASGLRAENLAEFTSRVLELSRGNPGVITAMVSMAKSPKYNAGGQIMVAPLYIDFRLNWHTAGPCGG
jgi:hypothetical protein